MFGLVFGGMMTTVCGVPESLIASCNPVEALPTVYPAVCVFAGVKVIVPLPAPLVHVPLVTSVASAVPVVAM